MLTAMSQPVNQLASEPLPNGGVAAAAAASPAAPVASTLDGAVEALTALVRDDLDEVNRIIVANMDSEISLIPQLAGYIVASGGKRLRPMLLLGAARLCGYEGQRHQGLAASVEFIHTATLLHDDVVDGSDLRRGKASANEVFGNKPSVLVGDFLFARAFLLMVADGSIDVLQILSQAAALIAEGEVMQLAAANDISTGEDTYLAVIRAKTAELFAAACEVGAVVAEAGPRARCALGQYGRSLGIAFQLADDVLDYSARQAKLGTAGGDDFREGKITLPAVLAIAAADGEERQFWRRCLEDLEQTPADLDRALSLMQRHGTLDLAMARARAFGAEARSALDGFPASPVRQILLDIVDFCIDRDY